jgi:hypothetical protein
MNEMATLTYMPLNEVAKRLPGHPHISTIHRWVSDGVRGVRLRSQRIGNRVFTTEEWIDEFIEELNTTDDERLKREGC